MALRENEQRILTEIEYRLNTDAPELAERLTSFNETAHEVEQPVPGADWKPWVVYGLIAVVMTILLVTLYAAAALGS